MKLAILLAALVTASVVAARQHEPAPQAENCTPAPISSMDPHPGLAPFRCRPQGEGPTIEADPARRAYGNGDRPSSAPPPNRARPVVDLPALADRKADAYLDYLDAQDSGDLHAAERARDAYERASARLEAARRNAR